MSELSALPLESLLVAMAEREMQRAMCFAELVRRVIDRTPEEQGPEVLTAREAAALCRVTWEQFRKTIGKRLDLRVNVGTTRPRYSRRKLLAAMHEGFSPGMAVPGGTQAGPSSSPALHSPIRRIHLRRGG